MSLCSGRSIIVGEGCVDVAFAVDCSKSMKGDLFNQSIEFVILVMQIFSIVDDGAARFALLTYDDKPTVHFNFDTFPSGASAIRDAINDITFSNYCWGATGTNKVLRELRNEVFSKSRSNCTKAAFLITDGHTNWGGSPVKVAKELRDDHNVTLYAIAVSSFNSEAEDTSGFDSLKDLVSKESYRMEVGKIDDIIKQAFEITVSKCFLDVMHVVPSVN